MTRSIWIKYRNIIAGMGVLAFGLHNIHSRVGLSEGGVLGATLLIQHWFQISPGISSFVIDVIFFGIGIYVLGRGFLRDSLVASISFSLWYELFEYIGYQFVDLSSHLLLASVLGAVFVGVGVGTVVCYGGAAGADDALALVLHKLIDARVGIVYLVSDVTILLLSLTYIPLSNIIYSLLTVVISGQIIDLMHRNWKPETEV